MEIVAEDEQYFLAQQQQLLQSGTGAIISGGLSVNRPDSPLRSSPGVPKVADRRTTTGSSPKKVLIGII